MITVRDDEAAERRGRGRRPVEDVRSDVFHAVGELLLNEGLTGLSFERIARHAGVSKTTLYRWWPSVGALALDGYFHIVEDTLAFPDTGDLRADLTTQLHNFVTVMTETRSGRVLAELIGQSQFDPDLAAAYRTLYSSQRRQLAVDRLHVGQSQGQIRPDIDLQAIVDQLWGAVYHRLLIPDEPISTEFADTLIGNLFDGIATPHGENR